MNIKGTFSDITVNFTPDEWPGIKKTIDFMVQHIEESNAADLELMKQYPGMTLKQIHLRKDNSLGNPLTPHE